MADMPMARLQARLAIAVSDHSIRLSVVEPFELPVERLPPTVSYGPGSMMSSRGACEAHGQNRARVHWVAGSRV